MRRHDLIFISPAAWNVFLQSRCDGTDEPLVTTWVARGWPLVARRFAADETTGISLGLPLPPSAGKRRIAVRMRREDVLSVACPVRLDGALQAAPEAWKPTLDALQRLAEQHGLDAHVFGSLAWRALTGLPYLSPNSDLDLLFTIPRAAELGPLLAGLHSIQTVAPMRIDGEVVRTDGAGVHWRELESGASEVLVKCMNGVCLLSVEAFLSGVAAA